ncbi:hypothetical protein GNY06_05050 [Elizabethkingia argentiflava]|uniref:Uncharacterized protein n=1 Tax=Elizabethkingia argenteiflava TaxID=2681556 RepID=A0A845PT07_9FLAO|nr:hypothetical protein [Elizabethkingia argenteiflava]NAW50775.1 hypothetical protein [Elizabethkingia argenteiflava]
MIVVKEFPNKQFNTKEELFKALTENKELLKAQKKLQTKFTDLTAHSFAINEKNEVLKSTEQDLSEVNTLRIKVVINTCNVFDSHRDVSINGSWNRTVKNTKNLLLLDSHKYEFDRIISDEVTPKVEEISWQELGYHYEGKTEALVFYCTLQRDRNPYMFDQYAKGRVKEHSGGLRYISVDLAINSEEKMNKEEKKIWDKYYKLIVNKNDVDDCGYFWAVTEQKILEGSAVVFGSNSITPTLTVEPVADTSASKDSGSALTTLNSVNKKRFINPNNF